MHVDVSQIIREQKAMDSAVTCAVSRSAPDGWLLANLLVVPCRLLIQEALRDLPPQRILPEPPEAQLELYRD